MVRGDRNIADIVDELAKVLPLSDQRKRTILQEASQKASFSDILVADDLTWEEFAKVNVMAPELDGVSAEVGELRSYPLQGAFYHTIGYVAKAADKDTMLIIESELKKAGESPDSPEGKARIATIRRLYKHPQMRVGKIGLESYGENELKGEAGKQRMLVNASGRVIDRLPSEDIAGVSGSEVVLALDAELQNFAISALRQRSWQCGGHRRRDRRSRVHDVDAGAGSQPVRLRHREGALQGAAGRRAQSTLPQGL